MTKQKYSFRGDFKRGFLRGLVVLLPTAMTLIILIQVYKFVENSIGVPINHALETVIKAVGLEELFLNLDWSRTVTGPGGQAVREVDVPDIFGFVFAILLVYLIGSFFASFLGRRLLPLTEKMALRIPIFKVIYPYAKQVTDFFLEEKKSEYQLVVAVPYPRKDIYAIGFLTGEGMKSVSLVAGKPLVNVFIPSSPTPVTGYTIFVDPSEIIRLNISVDQALRFTISGGVIIPPSEVQSLKLSDALPAAPTTPNSKEIT